jgi:chromosomal replication initiator protein
MARADPVTVALPSMRGAEIARIQATVALSYDIPPDSMKSAVRNRAVAWPRQVAMYLSHELTKHSLVLIGRLHGLRDHSTVIYSIRAVEKRMADSPIYQADVEALRRALS